MAELWGHAGAWVQKQADKYKGLFTLWEASASFYGVTVEYTIPSQETIEQHQKIAKLRAKLNKAYEQKKAQTALTTSRKKK